MQTAFAIVLFAVVGGGVVLALITAFTSSSTYSQIGRGGLSIDEDRPLRPGGSGGAMTPGQAAEREAEIRQMLEARSARRVRRGGEPLDVDAEFAALTRGALDPGIAVEVRQLVEARNARRVRQGKEPLDVEAEVARRLRELAD
jgi:hypothetical protein